MPVQFATTSATSWALTSSLTIGVVFRSASSARASEILYGEIPALQERLARADEAERNTTPMVSEEVSAQ
ncbi:MAG: hypothetical protein EOP01_01340, partial [Propionibacteriaceae bacterium]